MVNSKINKMKVFSQTRKIIPAKFVLALNNTNYNIEINRYNLTYIRMKIH